MEIQSFLARKGYSQTSLAEKLGTTSQNVNRWVTGVGVPSYEFCKKLLELGMTIGELFGIELSEMAPPTGDGAFLEGMANASDPEFNAKVERIVLEMKAKGQL